MPEKNPAASFQDLHVWRKSHALALDIYRITAAFPKAELFGLTSQMRRAAASLAELRYFLILANDLGYARTADVSAKADEVSRMLSAYERTILWSARTETA